LTLRQTFVHVNPINSYSVFSQESGIWRSRIVQICLRTRRWRNCSILFHSYAITKLKWQLSNLENLLILNFNEVKTTQACVHFESSYTMLTLSTIR